MSRKKVEDERAWAIRIVQEGTDTLRELEEEDRIWPLGDLWSFTRKEHEQLDAFRALVEGYIQISAPPRPLCLAVFGPPGSGKSYAVKSICKMLGSNPKNQKLSFTEVNLTELSSTADLIRLIRRARLELDGTSVPVIFFDEFDAPLAGTNLGWLSRFLAPMQDGTLFDEGERFELKRAVYIFGGGTADRMKDFGAAPGIRFREAKGPDFVSRLRGYIDVRGPNDPAATLLRRAQLIRSSLEKVGRAGRGDDTAPPMQLTDRMLDALLDVGRYRHGSRSIAAIIEMAAAAAPSGRRKLALRNLPPDHVLSVHRDLGPLDPLSIGGLIGLSIGSSSELPGKKPRTNEATPESWRPVSTKLALELWKVGAVLGYGGKWDDTYLKELRNQLRTHAKFLVAAASRLTQIQKPPAKIRVEVFARERPGRSVSVRSGMKAVAVPAYSGPPDGHSNLKKAAKTFLMRWTMSCRCVARVLVGGKMSGYSGRMPGILEETMLALSLDQPLYVIGSFGGGAQVVGELLGLASEWPPDGRAVGCFPESEDRTKMDAAVAAAPSLFRPAGFSNLPLTLAEAVAFVAGYSYGGPGWPDNGLTLDENRELFITTDQDRIIELVLRGLQRRFRDGADRPARRFGAAPGAAPR